MKKLFIIIISVILLTLFTACDVETFVKEHTNESEQQEPEQEQEVDDGSIELPIIKP